MSREDFVKFFGETVKEYYKKMQLKNEEYSHSEDAFSNFKTAGSFLDSTQEQALLAFAAKHFVSVRDLVLSDSLDDYDLVSEKIGDIVIYMILLLGMAKERGETRQVPDPQAS